MNALLEELIALRHDIGGAWSWLRPGRKPARRGLGGFHSMVQPVGRGLEFVESRPYAPGDDARSIDWRVTARQGKPHTKLYAAERERSLWIVVDYTGSMAFGSRVRFKSVQAARMAAWLAWAGKAAGNRLGGLRVEEAGVTIAPPVAGDRGVLTWLEILSRPIPEPGGAATGVDQLADALTTLRPRLRTGDRLFVISDFYALDDPATGANLDAALVAVAERGELSLLRVTDPLESAPPERGDYPVRVDGATVWVDAGAPATRERWCSLFSGRSARLAALARQHAWSLAAVSTVDDLTVEMPRTGVV